MVSQNAMRAGLEWKDAELPYLNRAIRRAPSIFYVLEPRE